MPTLKTEIKRRAAMAIVLAEEAAQGRIAKALASWAGEKMFGCDILSSTSSDEEPERVEVKGWGEPLLTAGGKFTYPQDIRASQFDAACVTSHYRIEIVANLDAYLLGSGGVQRLTLSAEYIRAHAVPRLYDVPLESLKGEVRVVEASELPAPPVSSF